MLLAGVAQCRTHNALNVIHGANIRRAGLQGLGPHLFVGYTMSADDTDSGEILRQMLDLRK